MRSRTAFAALPVALLVSGISLAEDSPKVVELRATLAAVRARVEPQLPKARKDAAAAEKQLAAVEAQIEKCQGNAARVRSTCEDNCEETMRRCVNANYLRSNAKQACEDRGEECSGRCSATEGKTCAALVSKKEKLEEVVGRLEALVREVEAAERAIVEQQRAEEAERERRQRAEEAERERQRRAEDEAKERRQPTGKGCKGRYIIEDEGNYEQGTGLVRDTQTNLRWLRFRSMAKQNQAQASSYCAGKGMRLPTKDEALAIAGETRCEAAWPHGWYTWTSTSAEAGLAWLVYDDGLTIQVDANNRSDDALCVR